MDWIHLAQDITQRWARVNTLMNLLRPYRVHFNIHLPVSSSYPWSLSFRFSDWNFLYSFHLCVLHVPSLWTLLIWCHDAMFWRLQITKLEACSIFYILLLTPQVQILISSFVFLP
jgi:hypothetical protein